MSGFLKDKKNLVVFLLSILYIIKVSQDGLRFAFWVLLGVLLCSLLDFIVNSIFLKKKVFPGGAIISGFIVSGILDYRQPWTVLIIFSLLPIISKHIIKFHKKHIFNPANFALFCASLFKIPLTWNLETNTFLIAVCGIYLAYTYRKLAHILGFLIFFVGLCGIFKINALGLISWFFVFIMLIEPKTSGYGNLRGFIFGGASGLAAFLMFKFIPGYDPFVTSLFIANLSNPLLEKIRI